MTKNDTHVLPHFTSITELVAYFDTHDFGDHLENMPEVNFDVDIQQQKHLFTLDEDLAEQLAQIASNQSIPSEVLINTWLRERITQLHTA